MPIAKFYAKWNSDWNSEYKNHPASEQEEPGFFRLPDISAFCAQCKKMSIAELCQRIVDCRVMLSFMPSKIPMPSKMPIAEFYAKFF